MDFTKEAVQEIRASLVVPADYDDANDKLLPPGWTKLERKIPEPAALVVTTLGAVVSYLTENPDRLDLTKTIVHVGDPDRVDVLGVLNLESADERRAVRRIRFMSARPIASKFKFGEFVDCEEAVIGLQAEFVVTPERDGVVKLLSSIKEGNVRETTDDGIGQEVVVRGGVTVADRATVPNPVRLRPFRTFPEVEQPESMFILRVRSAGEGSKPRVAFFDADGRKWRVDAIAAVLEFLRAGVGSTGVKLLG